MKKIHILLLQIIIIISSCQSNRTTISLNYNDNYEKDIQQDRYKILRIKNLEDKVYIIYAQKGDSIYKIVSEKEKYPAVSCKPIKKMK